MLLPPRLVALAVVVSLCGPADRSWVEACAGKAGRLRQHRRVEVMGGRWEAAQRTPSVATPFYVAAGPIRGLLRACNFWARAFPLFLRYKWAEWRINAEEEDDEAREMRWDRLHAQYAPHLLRHILQLRGYFIKVGQFASSRNDFIPARVIKELSKLQGDVPGMSAAQVRRVMELLSDMVLKS